MSLQIGMLAPQYVVGEQEVEVESLRTRKAVLEQFGMPDVRDVWGWRYFRRTQRTAVELACESVGKTLDHGQMEAREIDGLVLCCNAALNYHAQNRFLGQLTARLGLGYSFVSWVGGAGCASIVSAIQLASSLVLSGKLRNVLVVVVDKTEADDDRFQRFGVLSDAACSFVIRRHEERDLLVRAADVRSCPTSLENGGNDFQEKAQLIYAVLDRVPELGQVADDDPCVCLGNNVFLPVQELEFSVIPIDGLLLFQDNTARYGHCYASDPLINLVDFFGDRANSHVRRALIASSGHGHFGVVLIERPEADHRA